MIKFLKYGYNRAKYLLNVPLHIRNARTHADDGYPLPPPELVFYVTWHYDLEQYLTTGQAISLRMNAALGKAGVTPYFNRTLDFGCGCGRLIRHWHTQSGEIHGVDYNERLIDWCNKSLPFARFAVNQPESKLSQYGRDYFDFIYALSVFTHLSESQEDFWLRELHRILKPNGVCLITTMGIEYSNRLPKSLQRDFGNGSRVAVRQKYAGTNICGVYLSQQYMRHKLKETGWKVLAYFRGNLNPEIACQDMYVLRKA